MTRCILCRRDCDTEIYPGFVSCKRCGIAIRSEGVAADNDRKLTYGDNWVEEHCNNSDITIRTDYLLNVIMKWLPSKGRILDIGCASGMLVDRLVKAGYDAEGIDWSEDAISFAKGHMEGRYWLGDASLSTLQGAEVFDMIVASHIMEHLWRPDTLLYGTRRLLKRQAYLCIAVPNLLWYKPESRWRKVSSVFDPDHVVCYTPSGLSRLLFLSGIPAISITTHTHSTELLTALGVYYYGLFTGKSDSDSVTDHVPVAPSSARATFEKLRSLPLMSMLMSIPNRLSERNLSGTELIAVAKKGNY